MIRFFNTLGRRLEEFKPIDDSRVKLYTCGPTVYSYYQVGNLRNAVFNDTLRRVLEFNQFKVDHVINITDVGHLVGDSDDGDDKLEKGALKEGRTVWEVAKYYTETFKKDIAALNILEPNGYSGTHDNFARATDFIPQQIEIIQILLKKGFAYKAESAIYFDITKLSDYGSLSGQKIEEKEIGARSEVVTDSAKHHPQDFALWFFTVGRFAKHTMRWPSPWGEGFPGWHLECSAIIHATLSDPIDIHTGAVDLIGTHHTNEMAQTEAAYGHSLSNYWLHNEYLLVDGQRMAKSLGNFYTLMDITDRDFEPLSLRVLFLQAHYRTQQNFTWRALEAAQQVLTSWHAWSDRIFQIHENAGLEAASITGFTQLLRERLNDDLDTPGAIAALNRFADKYLPTREVLKTIDSVFGLDLSNRSDINTQQKKIIIKREESRSEGRWDEADRLREELEEEGIGLDDTLKGPIWHRFQKKSKIKPK